MTERPILFSAPMVRAILGDRKTQTRRIIKPQPFSDGYFEGLVTLDCVWKDGEARFSATSVGGGAICECIVPTSYAVADRLWVREAFSYSWVVSDDPDRRHLMPVWYWADGTPDSGSWSRPKPSIHMPRWASRITLEITDVRAQRLQDISEQDAIAEGCRHHHDPDGDGQNVIEQFSYLWQSIHGPDSWAANPWVVALTFRRVPQ